MALARRGYGDFTVPHKVVRKKKPRPASVPRPPRSSNPVAQARGGSQTLVDLAERMARESIQPDEEAIKQQRQLSMATAQQNAAIQQHMLGIAQQYLNPLAGQIQGGYNTASHDMLSYGKGFAIGQQMATQGNADYVNSVLKSIGAPEGQQIGSDVAQAAADTLFATGGEIPSEMFKAQGKGYGQAAAAYPKMADARYQDAIGRINADAAAQDSDYASRLAALEAQFPDLSTKYLLQLEDQQYQREQDAQKWDWEHQQFDAEQKYKWASLLGQRQMQMETLKQRNSYQQQLLELRKAGMVSDDQYKRLSLQLRAQQQDDMNAYRQTLVQLRQAGMISTDQYRQETLGLRQQGLDIQQQRANQSLNKPKFSATKIAQFKSTAADSAKDAFFGVYHIDKNTGDKVWDLRPMHYQEALSDLTAHGIPLTIAQRALNRYWKRPGYERDVNQFVNKGTTYWFQSGYGRPTKTFQERNPKANAAAETAAVKGRVPKNQAAKYIVGEAEKWLGTPYSWGGGGPGGPSYGIGRGANTKGFDCSGFIEYLYSKYGYEVGGVTYDQIKHGYSVKGQNYQPGDLIFFGTPSDPHHVGMYIGGNKFIESPYTGGHIQISSLNSRKDIVDVRRIFA